MPIVFPVQPRSLRATVRIPESGEPECHVRRPWVTGNNSGLSLSLRAGGLASRRPAVGRGDFLCVDGKASSSLLPGCSPQL